jgi:hypothetical protein
MAMTWPGKYAPAVYLTTILRARICRGRIAKAFAKIVMANTVVINIEDHLAFR